jgi:uncharacterized protein involved in outer membrane biogenesis
MHATIESDATAFPRPGRRLWHWRAVRDIPLILLGIIVAVWLVLFVTKGRFLRHPFERTASSLTGRKVEVGGDFQLYFAPFSIRFHAGRLSVSNPSWASRPNLFTADRIDSRIAPLSLLFGKRHLYWLDLTNGAADLEWNAARDLNTWSFSTTRGSGKPLQLPRVDRAMVAGTSVHYVDPKMPLVADLAIDPIASSDARIGRAVGLHGTGRVRETPFRVVAQLQSPDATVSMGENRLALRAWAANSVIDVTGTLPSLADFEDVPLRTHAHGHDMSQLIGIIGLAIPRTRTYDVAARMVNEGNVYRFTDIRGRFGDSDLAGRATITNGKRLRIDSSLTTHQLDIVDAAPFIGYDPDIVAIRGAVAAAAATGAGPRRIMPDASLPIATMQRFDASLDWRIGVVRSRNVPISDIHMVVALDHGRLAVSPLTFSMARGDIASDLVFDTRQRPSADSFDIRLSPTPMGRLLSGYGVLESGTTGIVKGRIRLDGRGDTMHASLASASGRIAMIIPQGSLWARNVQLSELDIGTFITKMFAGKLKEPVQINCGLIAFTVRDGVAAADPILIDTQKNLILGRGGFSFRTEDVDLVIRAHGKRFSLFSAQSPVRLGGNFAKPGLDVISPQLLARAGVGAGLGIVATPIAAVLAFVDIGNAKAAACGPVLAGANAAAQHTTGGKKLGDVGNGSAPPDLKAPTKASGKGR